MAILDNIALGLQGFGAGFQGRGPEFISGIKQERRQLSTERRQALLIDNRVLLDHLKKGRIPQARDLLANRAEGVRQLGGDPSDTLEHLGFVNTDVNRAIEESQIVDDRAILEGLLPAPAQPEAFTLSPGQARFEGSRQVASLPAGGTETTGGKLGTVSPKDFTVDSLATYQQTGKIADLVRFKPQIKDFAGIPHEFNPVLNKWQPIVDLNDPAIEDQVIAEANLAAIKQSKLDFTKQQSKFQGAESKHLTKIDSAKSGQQTLQTTIDEIKGLASVWNTQFGASLSGLPGSEARKLAGLLRTVKAVSAFGTLKDLKESGGTLGAISAPELELLEAALGTLDQAGEIDELVRVLDQISGTNQGSVRRIENAFNMDRKKFGSSFQDATRVKTDAELLQQYEVTPGAI